MADSRINIEFAFTGGDSINTVVNALNELKKDVDGISAKQQESIKQLVDGIRQATVEFRKLSAELKRTLNPKDIATITTELRRISRQNGERIKQAKQILLTEERIKKATALTKKANEDAAKATAQRKKAEDALAKATGKTSASTKKTVGILNELNDKLKQLKKQRAFATTEAEIERLNVDIQKTQRNIRELTQRGRENFNTFGNALSSFGFKFNLLANIASRVGSAITSSILRVFRDGVSTVLDFEQSTATLASILQKTRGEIVELTDDAQKFGATTFFTAGQVSQLQIELAKLGFTTEQIRGATEGALSLASAFRVDLATAAQVTASTVRGFNLEAEEAGRVADVIASAFANSALDLEKFQVAINKVAPIAASLNISLEATTSALGTLTNVGFDASTSGTQLRNILLALADTNSDLTRRIGFTVRSSEDFIKAFEELNKQGLKVEDTMQLVDKRSVALLQALTDNADATRLLNEEFKGAAGTAKKIADEQLKTLSGSILLLKSAWDGLILSIEDGNGAIGEFAKIIIKTLTEVFNLISGLGDANEVLTTQQKKFRETAVIVLKLIKSLTALATAILSVKTIALILRPIINGLSTALVTYRTATVASTTATGFFSAAAFRARNAVTALSASIRRNPIGILVTVLTLASEKLLALGGFFDDAIDKQKAFTVAVGEEQTKTALLFNTIKDTNKGRARQLKALAELKSVYGDYLGDLIDEKGNLTDIAKAEERVNAIIKSKIATRFKEQAVNKILLQQQQDLLDGTEKIVEAEIAFGEAQPQFDVDAEKLRADTGRLLLEISDRATLIRKTAVEELGLTDETILKEFPFKLSKLVQAQTKEIQDAFDISQAPLIEEALRNTIEGFLESEKAIKATDEEFDKYIKDFEKFIQLAGGADGKGRLIQIEEEIERINNAIKDLGVEAINAGKATAELLKIEALQAEAELIKDTTDNLKFRRSITDTENAAKIRRAALNREELRVIKLQADAEREKLKRQIEDLTTQEDTQKRILENGNAAAKEKAQAQINEINRLKTILGLAIDITEEEKQQAINEAKRVKFVTEQDRRLGVFATNARIAGEQQINIDEEVLAQKINILDEEVERYGITEELKTKILKDQEQERADIQLSQIELRKQRTRAEAEEFKSLIEAQFRFAQALSNKQTNDIRRDENAKQEALQARLDQGLISQQEFEDSSTQIKEEADKAVGKIQADAAKRDKQLATIQAIIDGALAVQKIQSQLGVASAPAIAISAIKTASQIALIQSQPIPEFEQGGLIEPGLLKGNRHSQGGIKLEAEGGEYINNRKSTKKYMGYLEAANQDRLPQFILKNDVLPALNLQLKGLKGDGVDFYDGNIVRGLQKQRDLLRDVRDGISNLNKRRRINVRNA